MEKRQRESTERERRLGKRNRKRETGTGRRGEICLSLLLQSILGVKGTASLSFSPDG